LLLQALAGNLFFQAMSRTKLVDYPEVTEGTKLAAIARKLASKLTPEQRAEHLRNAMEKIYGKSGTNPKR
jgi:hypothetical protein